MSCLRINLADLVNLRTIESNEVEFKATWDDQIKEAVVATVCAFANDFYNQNGGYIILGIEEDPDTHRPILPPRGIEPDKIESFQKQILGACKQQISPELQPLLCVENYADKILLIIWTPGGDNRPYTAPDYRRKGERCYFIRTNNQTLRAQGDLERQLRELTARTPFDDRRNLEAKVTDISSTLVKQFLQNVRSGLRIEDYPTDEQLYDRLEILRPINGYKVPRNVGLLFFNDHPLRFFPGAKIDVVQFGKHESLIEEQEITGPLDFQIRRVLDYLRSMGGTLNQKVSGQAEVERTVAYPYEALEEALVNAVYHRGYEPDQREPIKVYLYPDCLILTSYPGPMPGFKPEHLQAEHRLPNVPARNRRIGGFLKELRLAEQRNTGIRKIRHSMEENGSPAPIFRFSDSFFEVTLPVHPRYQVLYALREANHFWVTGEQSKAFKFLREQLKNQAGSGGLVSQLLEYAFALNEELEANAILRSFEQASSKTEASQPYLTMARLLIDRGRFKDAEIILNQMPVVNDSMSQLLEKALLKKRMGDFQAAHRLFSRAYELNSAAADAKLLHEFAQTKLSLASGLWKRDKNRNRASVQRFNSEAVELLHRAIQIAESPMRVSWCWFDLATKAYPWLRKPDDEIEKAFLNAIASNPGEPVFKKGYNSWKQRIKR